MNATQRLLEIVREACAYSARVVTTREGTFGLPHGAAMRNAFKGVGLTAYLCVEDTPIAAVLVQEHLDHDDIDRVHHALWNQGLASVLFVFTPEELRIYSLHASPSIAGTVALMAEDRRLVQTLREAGDKLLYLQAIADVIGGKTFASKSAHFVASERVDSRLLTNLVESTDLLVRAGLNRSNARALLIQTVFIAYLEAKGIIGETYFQDATEDPDCVNLELLLAKLSAAAVDRLFEQLSKDFNGDVFKAPCTFGDTTSAQRLKKSQLAILKDFRSGRVDLVMHQSSFWPYDFNYIPVELISAIYNRFLGDDPDARREKGAYYTPAFLADVVVDQVFDFTIANLPSGRIAKILDPACGSSIFLVRLFQRLAENLLKSKSGTSKPRLTWAELVGIAKSLHGWDLEPDAARISVFSLYIALLELAEPRELAILIRKGKLLPRLYGETVCVRDFFAPSPNSVADNSYDLIIGNPPWISRKGDIVQSAANWCEANGWPMPAKEIAWAFLWKATQHAAPSGAIAFLLPAMGILLNQSEPAIAARRRWLAETRLIRVINFSDLAFQLFDGADRPTALCIYRPSTEKNASYKFDYWCPKSSRLVGGARIVSLRTQDRMRASSTTFASLPSSWSRYSWATPRDVELLHWLGDLPKVGDFTTVSGAYKRHPETATKKKPWVIGQGFVAGGERTPGKGAPSEFVRTFDFLSANTFPALVVSKRDLQRPGKRNPQVYRYGFQEAFQGRRILIPQGIKRAEGRLRAAYAELPFCFQDSLQAIWSPFSDQANDLKLLTAILNSKLAAWFLFHETANFGADRAKVHEIELLKIPFPKPQDLAKPENAKKAKTEIVRWFSELIDEANADSILIAENHSKLAQLDKLVFAYFGLSADEVAIVEDTFNYVIPSMQPRNGKDVVLWGTVTPKQLEAYGKTLSRGIQAWLAEGSAVAVDLVQAHPAYVLVKVKIQDGTKSVYRVKNVSDQGLGEAIRSISEGSAQSLSRHFELQPNVLIFENDCLYYLKALELRDWTHSSALEDVDRIASEVLRQSSSAALEAAA